MSEQLWNRVHDFEYRGFQCCVVNYKYTRPNLARTFLEGSLDYSDWWCGYVFIPESNELHGKHYDDINISCHGGLTFANKFHVKDSKNFDKYAIGFDFNHYGDYGGDRPKAEFECKKIVDQLLETTFVTEGSS